MPEERRVLTRASRVVSRVSWKSPVTPKARIVRLLASRQASVAAAEPRMVKEPLVWPPGGRGVGVKEALQSKTRTTAGPTRLSERNAEVMTLMAIGPSRRGVCRAVPEVGLVALSPGVLPAGARKGLNRIVSSADALAGVARAASLTR